MSGNGRSVSITVLVLAGLVSLSMITIGVIRAFGQAEAELVVYAGTLGLIVTACAMAVVASMGGSSEGDPEQMLLAMKDVQRAVERMSQQAALSDDARRVLNRSKERELLCRAIEEDLRRHDWAAAQVLSDELAERFGYEAEAERFRAQIEMARAEGLDDEITEAAARVDRMIVERRWDDAAAAAAQAIGKFPPSPRVRSLPERVSRAREQYKHELERRFLMLAQAERVDEAMELLRELDAYLTEREAEPLQEVARGVIGKAKENLGAAFKLAYHDKEWGIALSVGQQIVEQFPNSRMAEEVAGMLDELRERASATV